MWKVVTLCAFALIPLEAMAQFGPPPSLPFSNRDLEGYAIPNCRDAGCDRQVVEPERAIGTWGQTSAASAWVGRVRAQPAYSRGRVDQTTCTGAVRAMFKLICDSDSNCEIEEQYRRTCLASSTTPSRRDACVKVVDDYVDHCFGSGCSELPRDGLVGGFLQRGNEAPSCSGAVFHTPSSHGLQGQPFAVTVAHCEARNGDMLIRSRSRPYGVAHLGRIDQTVTAPAFSQSIRAFVPLDLAFTRLGPAISPLGVSRPMPFERTVFQGYNSLIVYRNELVPAERARSPLWCDSSPLCTIVKTDRDELVHTCQSTRGGSGGALVQLIGGTWSVVGVNEGSRNQGLVSDNRGWPILSSSQNR
jgi:hypothetical protein